MSRPRLSEPNSLALKYALLAGIWIIASDYVLGLFPGDSGPTTASNIVKGLTFVAVTCIVLRLLAARMQSRIHEAENTRREELRQSNERLQRAKGMHAALVRANQAALTATQEEAILREISETMVGLAGLRLVRFSWVDEATRQVVPVS
jgi:hypothetical protein